MWENRGNGLGFGAGADHSGIDELGEHVINAELEAHLGSQQVNGFLDIQFGQEGMQEKMPDMNLHRGRERAGASLFSQGLGTFLIFLFYKVRLISDGIGNLIGDEILDIAESHDTFRTGLFLFFVPVGFVHL